MSNQKYYIVSAEALPEVFIKVAEARRMLQVGARRLPWARQPGW